MKLLVGLGNPGPQYQLTRHNAGFLFLDFVQTQLHLPPFTFTKKFQAETSKTTPTLFLAKPHTFMNLSGSSVQTLVNFYQLDPTQDLLLAFDDLDFPTGTFKVHRGPGPKSHNGLASVYQALGTTDFTHIRLGTDGRTIQDRQTISPIDYVLQKFPPDQLQLLQSTFSEILSQLKL